MHSSGDIKLRTLTTIALYTKKTGWQSDPVSRCQGDLNGKVTLLAGVKVT